MPGHRFAGHKPESPGDSPSRESPATLNLRRQRFKSISRLAAQQCAGKRRSSATRILGSAVHKLCRG